MEVSEQDRHSPRREPDRKERAAVPRLPRYLEEVASCQSSPALELSEEGVPPHVLAEEDPRKDDLNAADPQLQRVQKRIRVARCLGSLRATRRGGVGMVVA